MKVLIIEDEERGFSRLKRLLQNIDNSLEIQGPLTIIKSNLKSICKSQVSVLQILGFLKFGL